ncbi:hypothetical protein ACHAWX_003937 [Stephanocyclus meneghinianus]
MKDKPLVYGNHKDETSPYHWHSVILNLPGDFCYDATRQWVFKKQKDGRLASNTSFYEDDGRHMGANKLLCWKTTRSFCSQIGSLGMQDASWKCTKPTLLPGPTTGSVLHTKDSVLLTVSPEKWSKTQSLVQELDTLLLASACLPKLCLEQIRGFLIYVTRTYEWVAPHLKGLHLSINGWREGQDWEGYKVAKPSPMPTCQFVWNWESDAWIDIPQSNLLLGARVGGIGPRLQWLSWFVQSELQPSTSWETLAEPALVWFSGSSTLAQESSNFCEANNLVSRLEELEQEGCLEGSEVFLITDNLPFEGTFYKSHLSSQKLNDIILRLRLVQMQTSCILHVIHVAGTRMKEAGIDGLSPGDFLEGMMTQASNPLLSFFSTSGQTNELRDNCPCGRSPGGPMMRTTLGEMPP